MQFRLLRVLTLDVFPSINQLNPVYMQSLSDKNVNSTRYKGNFKVPTWNVVTFEDKIVWVLGS